MELEDLRELHDTYLSVQVQGNNGALPRLLTLFHICSVRDLRNDEVDILKETIAKNAAERIPGEDSSIVSFPTFMMWMRDVFKHQIGDLFWHHHNPLVPGPDRKGFSAAMLRDHGRAAGVLSPKSNPPESLASTRRGSFDINVPHSRRSSNATSTTGALNLGKMFCISGVSSAVASRHNSIPKVTGLEHLTAAGSKVSTPMGRVKGSRMGSRWISRENSRGNSRSNSLVGDADTVGDLRSDQNHKAVFLMKGLPPQEAMLARKQYRAISVDLTNAKSNDSSNDSKSTPAVNELALASALDNKDKLPNIAAQFPGLPQAPPVKPDAQTLAKARTIKQGLDPEMLVADAIAKLEMVQGRGDTPDADEEPKDELQAQYTSEET